MKRNTIVALAIAAALALWLIVGSCVRGPVAKTEAAQEEAPLPRVRYRISKAQMRVEEVILRGKTEPARAATLRAEAPGRVATIEQPRGAYVHRGDPLLRLDPKDLPARLASAQALVEQRQLQFNAAQKLQSVGYQSETARSAAEAALKEAQAQLASLQTAHSDTVLTAPFDGVVNERFTEIGEYVGAGDALFEFLELSPLIASAEATEIEVQKLHMGQEARAMIAGKKVRGSLRYISHRANPATRTYTVEFEFANPDRSFDAGMTADVIIPVKQRPAHHVSPALLYLSANTEGQLGIKAIDEKGRVAFHPTTILGGDREGFWVTGLPDTIKLITVGQGFVKEGAEVEAVREDEVP